MRGRSLWLVAGFALGLLRPVVAGTWASWAALGLLVCLCVAAPFVDRAHDRKAKRYRVGFSDGRFPPVVPLGSKERP